MDGMRTKTKVLSLAALLTGSVVFGMILAGSLDLTRLATAQKAAPPTDIRSIGDLSPSDRLPQWGLRPRQLRAIDFIKNNGFITNKYYSQLSDISERQALRELTEMVDSGVLQRIGKGRACRYVVGSENS